MHALYLPYLGADLCLHGHLKRRPPSHHPCAIELNECSISLHDMYFGSFPEYDRAVAD
jgi:hypothetical protein